MRTCARTPTRSWPSGGANGAGQPRVRAPRGRSSRWPRSSTFATRSVLSRLRRSSCTVATTSTRTSRRGATSPTTSPAPGSSSSRERTTSSGRPGPDPRPGRGVRARAGVLDTYRDVPHDPAGPPLRGPIDPAWMRGILHAVVERHHGVPAVAEHTNLLATFDGPARAVRCALEVVERARAAGLHLSAGLHTAEVTRRGATVAGAGVAADAGRGIPRRTGEVWVTSTLRDLTAGSGFTFSHVTSSRPPRSAARSSSMR